jgi:hypothetical protein
VSAELAARRTAAAAVVADFKRETDAFIGGSATMPDYSAWAWRLYTELRLVLDELANEVAAPAVDQRSQLGNWTPGGVI